MTVVTEVDVLCLLQQIRDIKRLSESYFAVKGAALILPQSECIRRVTKGSHGGDIQNHLQSMFYLLRQEDTIKVAVKLESTNPSRNRYLVVVATSGRQDTEESVILGVECNEKSVICLVLPVWNGTEIKLDGDGGFSITSENRIHKFKPVSVQAMWSALQSLIKVKEVSEQNNYFPGGLTHTWVTYYNCRLTTDTDVLTEWYAIDESESISKPDRSSETSPEKIALYKVIHNKLKEVMMSVDLEEVTSKFLRERCEEELGMDLREYRRFVDEEMMVILGQMDASSEIFDFLYLGSEWNASNLAELKQNGIGHILNITKEIDNFYPGTFHYMNIREWDREEAELLKYWEHTYRFIAKARDSNSKVLVHCKMGISRSSSTVMAFAMKDNGWTREEAYNYVKQKRGCVKPNKSFWNQLHTYECILDASKQRHNLLFRSKSDVVVRNRPVGGANQEKVPEVSPQPPIPEDFRPKSWSHNVAQSESALQESTVSHDGAQKGDRSTARREDTAPIAIRLEKREDYPLSSPSAQSTDDVFLEMTETPAVRGRPGLSSPGFVTLLSYNEIKDLHTYQSDEDSSDDSSEESEALTDVSDLDSTSSASSASMVAGYYDISMIISDDEEFKEDLDSDRDLQDEASWAGAQHAVPMESELREMFSGQLCADMSEEDRMARDRIALYFAASREDYMTSNKTEDSNNNPAALSAELLTTPLVNPQPTKVRADNSWIKEIPPSPHIVKESESQKPEESENADIDKETQDKKAVTLTVDDVSGRCASELSDTEVGGLKLDSQFEEVQTGTQPKETKPSSESESSPQNAHTLSVSSGSGVDVTSLRGSHERLQMEACEDFKKEDVSEKEDNGMVSRPTSIYETEDIHLEPGLVLKVKQEIEERQRVESLVSPSSEEGKPVQRSSSLKTDTRPSLVQKDRDTERRRTCTPVMQTPSPEPETPADNSMTTTTTAIEASENSPQEGSTNDDKDIKVYKVGHETVTYLPGKVRRQTKDFEEKYSESSDRGDESDHKETSPEPSDTSSSSSKKKDTASKTPTTSDKEKAAMSSASLGEQAQQMAPGTEQSSSEDAELMETLQDDSQMTNNKQMVTSTGSTSAYQEEDITWQIGAVKQHKEAFENISKENMQSGSVKRCSRDVSEEEEGQRMSPETLRLIREIGSCLLESPVSSRKRGQRITRERSLWESDDGSEEFRAGFVNNIRQEIERRQIESDSSHIILVEKTASSSETQNKETSESAESVTSHSIESDSAKDKIESVKVQDIVMNLEKNEEKRKERALSPEQSLDKCSKDKAKNETTESPESQPLGGHQNSPADNGKTAQNENETKQEQKPGFTKNEKESVPVSADSPADLDMGTNEEDKELDKNKDLIKVRDLVGRFETKESKTESAEQLSATHKGRLGSFSKTKPSQKTDSDKSVQIHAEGGGDSEVHDTVQDLSDTATQLPRRYSFSSISQTSAAEKPEMKRHSVSFSTLPALDNAAAMRQIEPSYQNGQKRVRKQHGKSHPLSRLTSTEPLKQRSLNPFYNTM